MYNKCYLIEWCCEKPQYRQADANTLIYPHFHTQGHILASSRHSHIWGNAWLHRQTLTRAAVQIRECPMHKPMHAGALAHTLTPTHTHTLSVLTHRPATLAHPLIWSTGQSVSTWNELEKNKNKERRSGWGEFVKILQDGQIPGRQNDPAAPRCRQQAHLAGNVWEWSMRALLVELVNPEAWQLTRSFSPLAMHRDSEWDVGLIAVTRHMLWERRTIHHHWTCVDVARGWM